MSIIESSLVPNDIRNLDPCKGDYDYANYVRDSENNEEVGDTLLEDGQGRKGLHAITILVLNN